MSSNSTPTVNPRVTVKPPTNGGTDWTIVEADGTVVAVASKRGEAREEARKINAERSTQEALEAQEGQQTLDADVPEQSSSPEDSTEQAPEPQPEPAEAESAPESDVSSESEVTPDGDQPDEEAPEQPEQDEAVAAAEAQANGDTPPAAEQAKPEKKPAKKPARKTPNVPTVKLRAGELKQGDRFVRNDIGIVTIDAVSKLGHGQIEIAYTKDDGTSGVYQSWQATHARREYYPGELEGEQAAPAEAAGEAAGESEEAQVPAQDGQPAEGEQEMADATA